MPTRSYGTFVGAYGVVGSSGVKERPKSVLIADASSVGWLVSRSSSLVCKRCAIGVPLVCTWCAFTGQTLDKDWTFTGQPVTSAGAPRLQKDYSPTTLRLQKDDTPGVFNRASSSLE